jgi:hypothetical protein
MKHESFIGAFMAAEGGKLGFKNGNSLYSIHLLVRQQEMGVEKISHYQMKI